MAEAAEAPKKKNNKLPIIIGAVVVSGGAAAAVMMKGKHPAPGHEGAAGADAHGAKTATGKLGKLINVDSFIVNLNETRSTRYLKIGFSLELGEADESVLAERKDLIRDAVITYLSGLTLEDVRGSETKAAMREELVDRINGALAVEHGIKSVIFTEFVVQ